MNQTLTVYWSGHETAAPLTEIPGSVDVVPLSFVGIAEDFGRLDFGHLTRHHPAAALRRSIREVRARGTRVTLSINTRRLASVPHPGAFAAMVRETVDEWGVDGIDVDYRPPVQCQTVLDVVGELREALGDDALLTAPVYAPWAYKEAFLHRFAQPLDYLVTMDYAPYPGVAETLALYEQYARSIGGAAGPAYDRLALGVSCQAQGSSHGTPLADVARLAEWEPWGGRKHGMMLHSAAHDVRTRTGRPDGSWTRILEGRLSGAFLAAVA